MAKKALQAKKTRTLDVKVLDVFGHYDYRIVVGIAGPKARMLNSNTGRVTSVSITSLQQSAPRCSQWDADATLRQVVRNMPELAKKWGLVQQ